MSSVLLPPNTMIIGEWNGKVYCVDRLLGEGAYGQVYLVKQRHQWAALKIGFDDFDLQSEINAIKALAPSRKKNDPYLLDADNMVWEGKRYPFYAMKYVDGQPVDRFLQMHGTDWVPLIGFRLLRQLNGLHQQRYIFGDIKKENILIREHADVELIDFGGATPLGKAVKQYTEVYDRGFWNAGSRVADEAYDLFSFALLIIDIIDPERRIAWAHRLPAGQRNLPELAGIASSLNVSSELKVFLRKCISGQYDSSMDALKEWRKMMLAGVESRRQDTRALKWLKLWFAASLLLLIAAVYVTFQ